MARKLLLLINSLEGGGAERVFVGLAEHLSAQRDHWQIRLATLDKVPDTYEPSAGIERIRLDCGGGFRRSIAEVERVVEDWQPDVVLSFLTRSNCAAVLARRHGRFRCVISERIHTTSHLGRGAKAWGSRQIVRALYPRADKVIAVSKGVADELIGRYRVPAGKVVSIPNPVFAETLVERGQAAPEIALPDDFLVSVGRLVPNKGGEIVLRAFAGHTNTRRSLVFLGEGPERARLMALAEQLGLKERVFLPGHVDNPHAVVARATAYVSASRSEGFPNALAEAMALGCAVISTDCHSGPAEILAGQPAGRVQGPEIVQGGILFPVGDAEALTGAMDLVDDPELRAQLACRAKERVKTYSPQTVFAEYERVLRA